MMSRSTLLGGQLKQTAVYWANPVPDGFGGNTFDNGVEIAIRWEERNELFIDSLGREKTSRAVLYVAQDVSIGEYLYLGVLADLASDEALDPAIVTDAFEISSYQKTPNVAGTMFIRKVWL